MSLLNHSKLCTPSQVDRHSHLWRRFTSSHLHRLKPFNAKERMMMLVLSFLLEPYSARFAAADA